MVEEFEPSVDAILLVGMLTRSKAIWKNPELLKLVEAAPSPNKAFSIVFQVTGSQRKAKAARYYRMAMRDYGESTPGALVAILQSPQGAAKLEQLLTKNPNHAREIEQERNEMKTENRPVQESELKRLHSELRDPSVRDCTSRYYTEKGAEAEIRRLARKTRPAVIEKLFSPDKCYTEGVTRPACTYDGCGGSDDEPGATWVQKQEFALYNLGLGQISLRKWWSDFEGEHLKQRMLEENNRSAARKDSIQTDKKENFE